MSKDTLIELSDINKIYYMGENKLQVLFDICLQIYENDFVSIVGPSGSGKTTLLNIMACLDPPTSGEYKLKGMDVIAKSNDDKSEIRSESIGFIFQSFNLISRHTAIENVEMPLVYSSVYNRQDRKDRAMECLEMVELTDRANHFPNELSGGQQQRVAIARALINNPKIIIADQPDINLDENATKKLFYLFESLNKLGVTVIMTSNFQRQFNVNYKEINL